MGSDTSPQKSLCHVTRLRNVLTDRIDVIAEVKRLSSTELDLVNTRLQILQSVDSRNIAKLKSFQISEDNVDICRHALEFPTLEQFVSSATADIPAITVAHWLQQMAEAVAVCHARGVFHGHLNARVVYVSDTERVLVGGWELGVLDVVEEDRRNADIRDLGKLALIMMTRNTQCNPKSFQGAYMEVLGTYSTQLTSFVLGLMFDSPKY
eukprot:945486_1